MVEVLLPCVKVGQHRGVYALFQGVFLPRGVVRLDVDTLQAVPCDDVKLPCAAVIFRRIACGDHQPAVGHLVAAEGLELQKLQHGGRQRFGHAVDLVQEQNALLHAALLHHIVHRGDDLGHGVFRYLIFPAAVGLFHDQRQAQRRLAGVVGHGIGHQSHAQLIGHLLHDGGLADARRAHQEYRALALRRNTEIAEFVAGEIRPHGVADLLFRLSNVHSANSSSVSSRAVPFACSSKAVISVNPLCTAFAT